MPVIPTLAEDLLLLLRDPRSGAVAGEGSPLFHVLAGAVLLDLALLDLVVVDDTSRWRSKVVRAVGDRPPADPLLHDAWTLAASSSLDVRSLMAVVGPPLRQQTLDRLVLRGHLRTVTRRLLGIFPVTTLVDTGSPRRAQLLAPVRATLVEGAKPNGRTAALASLLSASGALAAMHHDIPWSGAVYHRGKELERSHWAGSAASEAVQQATQAIMVSTALAGGALRHL